MQKISRCCQCYFRWTLIQVIAWRLTIVHDEVIKWKHFSRYWPFVRWIPHTKASDAEFWCFLWSTSWINGWVNNHDAGDLRCNRAHYDVIVMKYYIPWNIHTAMLCLFCYDHIIRLFLWRIQPYNVRYVSGAIIWLQIRCRWIIITVFFTR